MSFSLRLKERRESLKMSRTTLAKLIGVTTSAIGNYENGISFPKEEILYKIFDALKIEPNYLWQDEISPASVEFLVSYPEREHIKKYRTLDPHGKGTVDIILEREYQRCTEQTIPLSAQYTAERVLALPHSELKASAGTGFALDEQSMQTWTVLWNEYTRKADFCLDIQGDSMEPMFRDGDIILVRSQPAVDVGEIGLYILDGNGYVKRQGHGCLESLNPQYHNIVPDEFSCIDCKGLVLGLLKPEWIIEK